MGRKKKYKDNWDVTLRLEYDQFWNLVECIMYVLNNRPMIRHDYVKIASLLAEVEKEWDLQWDTQKKY